MPFCFLCVKMMSVLLCQLSVSVLSLFSQLFVHEYDLKLMHFHHCLSCLCPHLCRFLTCLPHSWTEKVQADYIKIIRSTHMAPSWTHRKANYYWHSPLSWADRNWLSSAPYFHEGTGADLEALRILWCPCWLVATQCLLITEIRGRSEEWGEQSLVFVHVYYLRRWNTCFPP